MNKHPSEKDDQASHLSHSLGRRDQLAVAFALMTVIPMLTLGYFLISYVIPHSLNRESVVFIISLNTLLASLGFTILRTQIRQKSEELVETNVKLQEKVIQLEALSNRLSELQEIERKNLAAELHDQIGGILTMLGIDLSVIRDHVSDKEKDATTRVNSAIEQTKNIAKHIRDVTFELRPTVLDDYGLQEALKVCCEHFTEHTSIKTAVVGESLNPRLPEVVETSLFRTVQEALNNIAKHAKCNNVTVSIDKVGDEISLIVEDDGKGFDPKKKEKSEDHSGMGLIMMRERIAAAGGVLTIESQESKGTRIIARIKRGTND